jgi:hypothetical protein
MRFLKDTHTNDRDDMPEYDFNSPKLLRALRLYGVYFICMRGVCIGLALYAIWRLFSGLLTLPTTTIEAAIFILLAFGAPFAVAGALMLALPSHPNLARRVSAALVVVAVAMVVTCAAVTRMSGRSMGMSVVGGLSSVGIMRSLVSQGKVR